MQYVLNLLILIDIQIMLAVSLSVIVGHLGLISLCHAIFFGVGAYGLALLTTELNISFFAAAPAAVLLAALAGWAFSFAGLRVKGDDFVLLTLSIQLIFSTVLLNWREVTKGPFGIYRIPAPVLPEAFGSEIAAFGVLATAVTVIACWTVARVMHSPMGRTLQAIREDETVSLSFGKDVFAVKRAVFIFSASIAGLAGTCYAGYVGYIDPGSFTIFQSMSILVVLIVGGTGNVLGAVTGAAFVVILPEVLILLSFAETAAAELRQLIYGAAMVLLMLYRPRGIAGQFSVGSK